MTIARWPRLSRATVTPRPTAAPADPKPWLHRRSVRNAPAPTALRVEPWDSEILRTLTDNACRDCGMLKCACPENVIAPEPRCTCGQLGMPTPVTGVEIGGTKHTLHSPCYVLPEPAPKAGEREVRVGDVWRHTNYGASEDFRIVELHPRWQTGPICESLTTGRRSRTSVAGMDMAAYWTLVSRAQPDAVDDGAVSWRDCATAEEALRAAGFVPTPGRGDDHSAWYGDGTKDGSTVWCYQGSRWYARSRDAARSTKDVHGEPFDGSWRRAIAHALGESPNIARGPVPT